MALDDITFEHTVTTSPAALTRLAASLDPFEAIAPELAVLAGTGGTAGTSLVTDGSDFVFVNAEGHDYARYHSPVIDGGLADAITARHVQGLTYRKTGFTEEDAVRTRDWLDRLAECGDRRLYPWIDDQDRTRWAMVGEVLDG